MTFAQRLSLVLIFVLLLVSSANATEALNPESRFLSRALLSSPATGLSFMTPRHFRGAYDVQTGTFFLKNRGGLLIGVYGFSEATLDEVDAVVTAAVKKLGITLTLEEKQNLDQNTVIAVFQTDSPQGKGIMVRIIEVGKDRNTLAMIGFGKTEKKEQVRKKLKRIMAQVEWKKPEAQAWRKKWIGRVLNAADAAGTMTFCGDGSYVYDARPSEKHQGKWRVIANLVGEAILVLNATDGKTFRWPIAETASGASLNGKAYQLEQNAACE